MRGRIRSLQWDETAVSNLVTVPIGHLWHVWSFWMRYIADANVASRQIDLTINQDSGPIGGLVMTDTATANQTRALKYGVQDQASIYNGANESGLGEYLEAGDTIELAVTNEQAGDTWDVWGIIEDFVAPRL